MSPHDQFDHIAQVASVPLGVHTSDRDRLLTDFLQLIDTIPWFSRTGIPDDQQNGAVFMTEWEQWPGPDDAGVQRIHHDQQALYDQIMSEGVDQLRVLTTTWEAVQATVLRVASSFVAFDPDADAWHAPTTAVWQAAWTAGLICLCLYLRKPIPDDLMEQWRWFLAGHWPAGYQTGPDGLPRNSLIVL